jgi:hypothetical protein
MEDNEMEVFKSLSKEMYLLAVDFLRKGKCDPDRCEECPIRRGNYIKSSEVTATNNKEHLDIFCDEYLNLASEALGTKVLEAFTHGDFEDNEFCVECPDCGEILLVNTAFIAKCDDCKKSYIVDLRTIKEEI